MNQKKTVAEAEMTETRGSPDLRLDHPLRVGQALDTDALDRQPVAQRVVDVLARVSPEAGLVVSVEGAWGCGKTSLLAMVEELLAGQPQGKRPVVVHFNPWLIGDRDALVRQFLACIAKSVKLADHAKEGKRVAKELKTYAKAFDVLKLIPGAEPWASIVKSVVESMGDAGDAVFDYKTPDIEARKDTLARALQKFPQRIIVLIDDLDRLYPAEVYEMVRIIKAVGDLPNVGYVLAWDEKYVGSALDRLGVPYAAAYLDKVVQVRLPVPSLSFPQRVEQMNRGLARLPVEAMETYFPNGDSRHGELFHHGLSELIEHPRDVVRLFDVVTSIEKDLRGEIHLADIIGLACLMTKAPPVFELLRSVPQAFVGRRPGARPGFRKAEEVIEDFAAKRNQVVEGCPNPKATKDLVHFLFPKTAKADDAFTFDRVVFTEGHLAHPDRLLVALQLSTRPGDVSLVKVRRYLFQPAERGAIAASLDEQSCAHFVGHLCSIVESLEPDVVLDSEELALSLARLIEQPPFVRRARQRSEVWLASAEHAAESAIGQLARRLEAGAARRLAERLICDEVGLSVAIDIALASYGNFDREPERFEALKAAPGERARVLAKFAENLERAATTGELFEKATPGHILWNAALLVPKRCGAVFAALRKNDPTLDRFAEAFLQRGFDSNKGQSYAVPKEAERLEKYVDLAVLKSHAAARLKDETLGYPVRAAWRALAEGKALYGRDGSLAVH